MKKKLMMLLMGAGLVLGACGGGGDQGGGNNNGGGNGGGNNGGNGGDTTAHAEQLINQSCISCHGQNLEGAGAAPAINNAGATYSQEEIYDIIVNGKGAMPGGLLTGEDAEAVAQYLSEQK